MVNCGKAQIWHLLLIICFSQSGNPIYAQDKRADYSSGIKNMYLNANFGIINYRYTEDLLPDGVTTESITGKTTFGGRFAVGYHLSKSWDAQLSVMRPAAWASYNNLSIEGSDKSVWTNIWALSAKKNFQHTEQFKLYLETGISNVARHGFKIADQDIIENAQYLYPIFGSGLNYRLSNKWEATLNITYSPPREKVQQPATTFFAGGITYNLKEPDDAVVKKNSESIFYFPKHLLQIGITSDFAGYDINRQFSGGLKTSIPIFWFGDVFVQKGLFINYQRNIFHTYKNFSLDWGASFGYYQTKNEESFYTLSLFPTVRYWFLRTKPIDVYFNYSLIGPAYISKSRLDGLDIGEEATFQDFMGIGFLFGNKRLYNIDLKIAHYSNGNIFNDNPGVAIPLTICFGMALY
tara:strand:+ start:1326 stop:2546 length:1221 start_codon:yes stop_codon:yes gene_type:complete